MGRERNEAIKENGRGEDTKGKRRNKNREMDRKNNWPSVTGGYWGRKRRGNWRPAAKRSTNIACSSCQIFDFGRVALLTCTVGKYQLFVDREHEYVNFVQIQIIFDATN